MWYALTPSKMPEISMKNWRAKVNRFLFNAIYDTKPC